MAGRLGLNGRGRLQWTHTSPTVHLLPLSNDAISTASSHTRVSSDQMHWSLSGHCLSKVSGHSLGSWSLYQCLWVKWVVNMLGYCHCMSKLWVVAVLAHVHCLSRVSGHCLSKVSGPCLVKWTLSNHCDDQIEIVLSSFLHVYSSDQT